MTSAFIENLLALMTMWIEYWVKHLDRAATEDSSTNEVWHNLIYPSSVTLREGNLHKPYQSINTSYLIRKTWWLYLLLEKNLAIASYTKALFVQKWQMFSESDRRGIQQIAGLWSTAAAVGKLVFVDALTWVYSIYLQSAVKGIPSLGLLFLLKLMCHLLGKKLSQGKTPLR